MGLRVKPAMTEDAAKLLFSNVNTSLNASLEHRVLLMNRIKLIIAGIIIPIGKNKNQASASMTEAELGYYGM
jgi:hypothetical protein